MNGPRQLCVKVIPMPGNTHARVHNIDKTVDFQHALDRAVQKKLKDKKYAYFYAVIDGVGTDAKLLEVKANCTFQGW